MLKKKSLLIFVVIIVIAISFGCSVADDNPDNPDVNPPVISSFA